MKWGMFAKLCIFWDKQARRGLAQCTVSPDSSPPSPLCLLGCLWFVVANSCCSYSPGIGGITRRFGVGEEVATIGTALLLFGMGVGPLVWAPLSEVYGRKTAVLGPYFFAAVFIFGSATAKDIQTVMITRFFAGFFGSAPVTNTGGVLSDLWSAEQRGVAMVGYAMAVVGGPVLGPIVGGAISQSYLGWRWNEYVRVFFFFFFFLLAELLSEIPNKKKKEKLTHGTRTSNLDYRDHDVLLSHIGRDISR